MNKKLLGIIVIVVIGAIGFAVLQKKSSNETTSGTNAAPTVPAIDVAVSFMDDWLDAREATDTTPVESGLTTSDSLTQAFAATLQETEFDFSDGVLDPVLCQTTIPNNIRSKVIVDTPEEVQVYTIANKAETANQAIIKLVIEDGEWKINEIECGFGETPPEQGEYSFEKTGQLLKSVPPPLDPNFWYLVYEDQGLNGLTAKLTFDQTSVCIESETESVCNPDSFTQTATAKVQGDISEAGVVVKRVTFE